MDFKITEYKPIETIGFNYEELKAELIDKTEYYQHIVYTEDTIKSAKTDRADLNKLKKALNDKRLEVQREILKPLDDFKTKIDELVKYIDKSVTNVDMQVKEYEAKVKREKEDACRKLFENLNRFDWLTYDQVADGKWLNASTSMTSIQESIEFTLNGIESSISALHGLPYEFEATECYKKTLSLAQALEENKKLAELAAKKAELEKAKEEVKEEPHVIEVARVEAEPEEEKELMTLEVKINSKEYDALTEWLDGQGIEWSMR